MVFKTTSFKGTFEILIIGIRQLNRERISANAKEVIICSVVKLMTVPEPLPPGTAELAEIISPPVIEVKRYNTPIPRMHPSIPPIIPYIALSISITRLVFFFVAPILLKVPITGSLSMVTTLNDV
jgi:hypothetical protein